MKKTVILALIFGMLISICGCTKGETGKIIDNDHYKASKMINDVLEAIQSEDKDQLRTLFSKTALSKIQTFDIAAVELFNYYKGTFESYDDGAGAFVETTKEGDQIYQLMESSFSVKTELDEYRFAMQYVTMGNENDIGLISLYVVKISDDKHLDYTYWGDGLFLPGIHVAVPNEI